MRFFLTTLLFLTIFSTAESQDHPTYSRAKILLENTEDIHTLTSLGVICHGEHAKGRSFTSDFSAVELDIIRAEGFEVEILIADVQEHYVNQNKEGHQHHQHKNGVDCTVEDDGILVPSNFNLGSMGGYLTYAELLAELDDMYAQYPNLISAKAPISTTTLTHEGREVYWLRISDNPSTDESTEPEIFYNSLIHSREPGSMQQMVFYMWYLLENYDSNPEIKYLVDNVEMYFVPCVNPDGYVYNESTNPNGGGLWRKNRRNNGNGSFGVDLNRNFGHSFAYDDNGSSPNPNSDTYRGTSEFSEPETQLFKMFVEAHDFEISLNYHTYSKLFLRPWGHIADDPAAIDTFDIFGNLMVEENGYQYGGPEVIGYFVNGDQDGYLYGSEDIISYTPEVGSSFWPPMSEIEQDAKDNLAANLYAARFMLNYGRASESNNEEELSSYNGSFDFNIRRYGYKAGNLTASLESTSITTVSDPVVLTLNHLDDALTTFTYELDNSINDGDELVFNLVINNGEQDFIQSFKKVFTNNSSLDVVLSDDGTDLSNWQSSTGWGITNARYFSEPTSIADSPQTDYQNNNNTTLSLNTDLDLSTAIEAYVTFRAEWDIESGYDYSQLRASSETLSLQALCGNYTKDGNADQDQGEPLWDGVKTGWVLEKMPLDDFLGQSSVSLEFRLVSDTFVRGDGFFFDDFEVVVLEDGSVNVYDFEAADFIVNQYPNPASEHIIMEMPDLEGLANVVIYNSLAQEVIVQEISQPLEKINVKQLANGIYYYTISQNGRILATDKVVVGH